MGKYVSIGQLRTQIQTSFASLKTYMDEKVRDPILNTAQQAKTLADSVVQRANAGEFKGERGDQGPVGQNGLNGADGQDGADGADAKVNGVNTLTITVGDGLSGTQSGSTYSLSLDLDNYDRGEF